MSKHPIVHIELSSRDAIEAGKFYSEVFGWKVEQMPEMSYAMFEAEGGVGGGFNPVGVDNPTGTVVAYIDTDNIEDSLAIIEAHGGKTLLKKTEIPGMGWFAFFSDPTGNKMGLFQDQPGQI